MSTSIALVTCAEVSSDLRMWSAIPRRIADIGSNASPTAGSPAGCGGACATCAGAGGAGAAAGAGAAGAAGAASLRRPARRTSMKAWMSFFVTRPPEPEPGTCDGSIPCSAAMRATTGETNDFPFSAPDGARRGLGRR